MKLDFAWEALQGRLRDLETLEGMVGLLEWDQQTQMPAKGAENRGEQMAFLQKTAHALLTAPQVGEWLAALEEAPSLDPVQAAALRNTRRVRDRAVKVEGRLVEAIARAQATAFGAWIEAKGASDFSRFAPSLESLIALTREKAASVDSALPTYDVLLEEFDPGVSTASLRTLFPALSQEIGALLRAISEVPPMQALEIPLDTRVQRALQGEVVERLGFSFAEGRLDEAEHPFTVGIGPGDVRITTHLYERDFLSGLGGAIHEAGHAMYELGLPYAHRGTSVARAASMGLHESQSRFWENFIGRSRPFCQWLEGVAERHFPGKGLSAEVLYRASNRVSPGLIRVAADEVTYNLHIAVRFELEAAIFEGLAVRDLPDAWNARYAAALGVHPKSDAEGVLQDVHWSSGAFGYFPSYTLGNLYAVALGNALERAHPTLWEEVARGDFAPTLAWLRENVHSRGSIVDSPEIVRAAAGDGDLLAPFVDYLWGRHGALHGVSRAR